LANYEDDMRTLTGALLFLLIAGGATLAALAENTLLRVVGAGLVAIAVGYVVGMTLRERKRRATRSIISHPSSLSGAGGHRGHRLGSEGRGSGGAALHIQQLGSTRSITAAAMHRRLARPA
jgi:hypothetical protein